MPWVPVKSDPTGRTSKWVHEPTVHDSRNVKLGLPTGPNVKVWDGARLVAVVAQEFPAGEDDIGDPADEENRAPTRTQAAPLPRVQTQLPEDASPRLRLPRGTHGVSR